MDLDVATFVAELEGPDDVPIGALTLPRGAAMKRFRSILLGLLLCWTPQVSAQIRGPSVFTVHHLYNPQRDSAAIGCNERRANELSMIVGVVEFEDNAAFVDSTQLRAISACIREIRRKNPNGVVVTVFAHGWHHNADWNIQNDQGDEHFRSLRLVGMSLTQREAERYGPGGPLGRTVIVVYIGWRGAIYSGGAFSGFRDLTTLKSRYAAAERIGAGTALRSTIRELLASTKSPMPMAFDTLGSPLVFAGHSLGALMMETAFLGFLRDEPAVQSAGAPRQSASCAIVRRSQERLLTPDLVLLLNSATESHVATELVGLLRQQALTRRVDCGSIRYDAPLLVSVTSERDLATKTIFPMVRRGLRTEGHDSTLRTHRVITERVGAVCRAKQSGPDRRMEDFNQSWHCLRKPVMDSGLTSFAVDLPQEDDTRRRDDCHVRYRIVPASPARADVYWNLQVPGDVIGAHSDVFNGRSNLFVMALMQLSGGILSLANSWTDVFEDEQGRCQLP